MKRTAILGLLIFLPSLALAQGPEESIHVKVNLVNVFVTVTDSHGAPVGGLQKSNFQLLEDGEPQKIAVFDRESEMPLSIVLAVDTSLSTRRDLPLELSSARRFVQAILRPVDSISLFQFSEVVDQLTPFISNLKQLDRAIQRVHPGAATALYDALYLGSQALEKRQGRKVLVVITDGGDTVSTTTYKQAVREAQDAEAMVFSIIVVPIQASAGRDTGGEHALIQLSEDTGGHYFYANSVRDLDSAFRGISDALRTQYLLAYYPSQQDADSDFHRITVNMLGLPPDADYQARYRTGYYTSKSSY